MPEVKGVILWAEQMNDALSTKPEVECWWLLCEDSLMLHGLISTVMSFGSSGTCAFRDNLRDGLSGQGSVGAEMASCDRFPWVKK